LDHASKFLPVLGEKVYDLVLQGYHGEVGPASELTRELRRLWKCPDADSREIVDL
jgi:sarcosine oxidase/L-pipecolate oxidase